MSLSSRLHRLGFAGLVIVTACSGDPPGGSGSGGSTTGSGGTKASNAGTNASGGASSGGPSSGAPGSGGANAGGANTGGASAGGASTGGANEGGASTGGANDNGTGGVSGSGSAGMATGGGGGSPSSGCGSTAPRQSGTYTINVGGTEREYILTLPDNYDPNHAYPMIFGWHPLGGSAQGVANTSGFIGGYYGLRSRANNTVIFVAGQGLPDNNNNRGWPNTNGRDIAFLRAMLERFRSELCIDESRLLSTGFSFGGMMSDLIACQLGRTFRAVAPMAGTLITSYNTCVGEPVAAMVIHGDVDDAVPISGGRQFRDYLRGTNNCGSTSTPVEPSPCVAYAGCDAGYPVTWCEFSGAHTVPNFASAAIWNFFSQFL
jgi:polyhydroxybutyrate depolymerase